MWVVQGEHLLQLTTLEAVDLPDNALSRSQRSKATNASNVVKGMDMGVAVAIREAEDGLLETRAELISMPSLELLPFMSANDTKRRDFASSAIRRETMSFNARRWRAKHGSIHLTSRNDGGKDAFRTSLSKWLHLLAVPRHC
jgi:hypothetical protein